VFVAPGAGLRILWPTSGLNVGSQFTVRVRVSGFRLQSTPNAAVSDTDGRDVGHLEFVLDGGRFDQPRFAGLNGRLGLEQGVSGFYSPAYRPEITYRNIPAGRQVLVVRLANVNGVAMNVSARVWFDVR
jgi:hypothetical protein